jgi:hypothetical protein
MGWILEYWSGGMVVDERKNFPMWERNDREMTNEK